VWVERILLELLLILLLLIANGFFSMSEMAIVSSRRTRLHQAARAGNRRAQLALALAESPDRFLSTIQIGITLIGILAGALGGATLAREIVTVLQWLGEREVMRPLAWLLPYQEMIGVGLVVLLITYLSLVIGELVPKRLALNRPEQIAFSVAGPMKILSRLASPLVHLLEYSTAGILRLLRIQLQPAVPISEEEVKILLEQGTQSGVFNPVEESLVRNIFRLADQPISTLMTPRLEMSWLDIDSSLEDLRRRIIHSPHTHFPVGRGSIDHWQGVVKGKELLALIDDHLAGRKAPNVSLHLDWTHLLHKVPLLLETRSVLDALEAFRFSPLPLAFVVDPHQSIEGLVTTDDLLHAIVTEAVPPPQPALGLAASKGGGDTTWMLDGSLSLLQLKEIFPLGPLPGEERGLFTTLSGFLMSRLGRVPIVGDLVEWAGYRFEVATMQGRRIAHVLVTPPLSVLEASLEEEGGATSVTPPSIESAN
jgi:putative hemolysin